MLSAKIAYQIKKERETAESKGIKLQPVFREYQESIAKIVDYKDEYEIYIYPLPIMKLPPQTIKCNTYEEVETIIEKNRGPSLWMYEVFLWEYGYYVDKDTSSRSLIKRCAY